MLNYHSVDAAIAWVEAVAHSMGKENVPLPTARGRVLAEPIYAARPIPADDRARLDGFAVQASASLGAGAYNPVRLPLIAIAASEALPVGTDAVIPIEMAEADGQASIEVVEAVTAGDNVEQQGAVAMIGTMLAPAGTRLTARHIGLLMSAGLSDIPVVCRPRVRLLVVKPTQPDAFDDSDGPMICAAIARDGGIIGEYQTVDRDQMTIRAALLEPDAEIVLVIGGTGPGRDDHSAAALEDAGELAIHGVALLPGETTGLGRSGDGTPIILLPGAPAACLWSYELFAGRAIRRLGGRHPNLPYRSQEMITVRKIASSIGMTEICPVRCAGDESVEPRPSFVETGLMAAVDADGFVIVPHGSEGYPQGARITVYLYDGC